MTFHRRWKWPWRACSTWWTHEVAWSRIARFEMPPPYGSVRKTGVQIYLRDGRVMPARAFAYIGSGQYVDVTTRSARRAVEELPPSEDDWREPTWRYDFGDSVDYGVELETTCGRVFTVTCDSPGWHERIWLREVALMGEAVIAEANVAVWNVSRAGRWDRFVGPVVGDVRLAYKPWAPDDGYWCSRITVTILDGDIQLLVGEGQADQQLHPSVDNIAILFPPSPLPD